ncbi:MAG TPA: efflux RND transporter periplasmic adaptor subunit [Patescibacteria group bacterium]
MDKIIKLKNRFTKASPFVKFLVLIILLAVSWFIYKRLTSSKSTTPQYQTSTATRGTLVSAVTSSGNIAGGNSTTIHTSASGLVTKVYVKNGDKVSQGQKLADLELDQDAGTKQTSAWAAYLTAQNNYQNAIINKAALISAVDSANKSVMDNQNAVNTMNNNITNGVGNPQTHQSYSDLEKNSITSALTVAQENYDIANQKLAQADAAINTAAAQKSSAWFSYQQTSPTITAPASGVLTNFALTPGLSIGNLSTASSSNSNSSNATQSVGVITNPNNQVTASISLSEMDVVKVQPGQKVTLTLDAFPGKTFTGKVLSINTNGQVSSGVTTYPTTIIFDNGLSNMYPNMAVSASIITAVKDDVVMVPNTSVETDTSGSTSVRILKNNQITSVPVTVGASNDTDTEIVSGINEGETVVTAVVNPSTSGSSSLGKASTSPFSSFGGGAVRFRN